MAPQSHPQAQFVPISPDLDLSALVENTPNFDYVTRLPRSMLEEHSAQSLEQLVLLHVVVGGKPLVLEGWEEQIDPYLFSPEWLQKNLDKQVIKARDIPNAIDVQMSMGHYIRNLHRLTNQFNHSNYRDPKRQRLYLKDMDTPEEWAKAMKSVMPESVYYLNECIESRTGGDGAELEPNEYGQMTYGKGVAPAGDLMSSLPTEMQAVNMMCYIGHEGTNTPAHREMCASLGHNIMVEASENKDGEKEGTAIWFMTETKEREVVSEYFLSMLGHDIEVEKHFAQVNAWKKAPFNVWVVEQKVGDLILIPPLAPHQVWNRGTRTIKAAWNRTTVDTLELALHEALPRARMVCRDEQYKNKAIIYYTLEKYYSLLRRDTVEPKMWKYGRIKQVLEDFKRLFALYGEVLVSEMFGAALPAEKEVEFVPYDSNITCSYCRCNIFNRFLTCKNCNTGDDDTYDICMDCYAMGRSCGCIANLNWVEQWEWSKLVGKYELWRQLLVQGDGYFDSQKSPQPLEVARKRYGRKPVAQVCQEQLKIRPFYDPANPAEVFLPPAIPEGGKKKKRTAIKDKTASCHVGLHHEWNWKMAFCTTCDCKYAYGVLWRAFDLMPQEVMEDRDWSCPKCQGICSCAKCRVKPNMNPYEPKGTLLGHDTRLVADHRSVESLVDFSTTNLRWLRGENDDNPRESSRMQRLKAKAEADKAREDVIDENYFDLQDRPVDDNSMVDPTLEDSVATTSAMPQAEMNGFYEDHYSTLAGNHENEFNEAVENDSYNFFDGHEDINFRANQRTTIDHPAGLLDPQLDLDEPARGSEEVFVDPADLTTHRMMGAGYWQQDGAVDKILYVAPAADETVVDPAKSSISAAANLALSDLQPPAEPEPKKRRHGDGADDVEFFTSKRQKKIAESKKVFQLLDKGSSTPAAQRQPRRSTGKPQHYIDLGEEAIPFSEEDIVPTRKPKSEHEDTNGILAAEAQNALEVAPQETTKASPVRRRSRKSGAETTQSPSIPVKVKKPQHSAWLARKEADDSNENFPAELPPRTHRKRRSNKSAGDDQGDGQDEDSHIPTDDSPFGDHDSDNHDEEEVEWRPSDRNPAVKIAEPISRPTPIGKRRGRPPKMRGSTPEIKVEETFPEIFDDPIDDPQSLPVRSNIEIQVIDDTPTLSKEVPNGVHNVDEEKDETPDFNPAPPAKRKGRPPKNIAAPSIARFASQLPSNTSMLSLKEKLALKGKSAKIVTAKSNRPVHPVDEPTGVRSLSASYTVFKAGAPLDTTSTTATPSRLSSPSSGSEVATYSKSDAPSSTKKMASQSAPSAQTASIASSARKPEAIKKGPTVVRLMSYEVESGDDDYASSDSSNDSIPAVLPPPQVRGNMARRGGRLAAKGK